MLIGTEAQMEALGTLPFYLQTKNEALQLSLACPFEPRLNLFLAYECTSGPCLSM